MEWQIPRGGPIAHWVQIKLKIRGNSFCGGRKTREPGEKPSKQGDNQKQTRPLMTLGLGFELRPHWWDVSALITAPSMVSHPGYTYFNQLGQ